MKRALLVIALVAGCEPSLDTQRANLTVYAIPGLPVYDGGRASRCVQSWHQQPTPIVCSVTTACLR